MLEYWRGCVGNGGFLVGRDIPARPIAGLLGNIMLTDMMPDTNDMTVRLAGAGIRPRFGGEIKGRKLSEIFPPSDFAHHMAASTEIIRDGEPFIIDSRIMRMGTESNAEMMAKISRGVMPPGVGTPVPGAYEASITSMSTVT